MEQHEQEVEKEAHNFFRKLSSKDIGLSLGTKGFLGNLFLYRLHFPPKMFEKVKLLEFGINTGEQSLFFLESGASTCTFVEINELACQRAEKLFQAHVPDQTRYKILNKSILDFNSDEEFDIVVSLGVLHHVANKEKAFERKSKHLKSGGFLIIGISNTAGFFQRNLQRVILRHLSNNEEEMVSYANDLFSENIDRAVKFGRRSRKSVIYDTYICPTYDTPTISEVLSWFAKHNIRLYSSWPPIIPAFLGDSAGSELLEYEKINNILSLPEIAWLAHKEDDIIQLAKYEQEVATLMLPFKNLIKSFDGLTSNLPFDLDSFNEKIDSLIDLKFEINPYTSFVNTLQQLLREAKSIVSCLKEDRIDDLKRCIKGTKILFRGTCGLGMNFYIGHKM